MNTQNDQTLLSLPPQIKQKRGRKSKKDKEMENKEQLDNKKQLDNKEQLVNKEINNNVDDIEIYNDDLDSSNFELKHAEIENEKEEEVTIKKRGRKPKGGKIIQQPLQLNNNKENRPNIILHLKCCLADLNLNTSLNQNIESFNFNVFKNDLTYENIQTDNNIDNNLYDENVIYDENSNKEIYKQNNNDNKEIWKKLKNLQHNLHINNINDKKSACFWCTHEFDNPPVYIPKYHIKESYHVYGCFCSPECATAFLMKESLDSSVKFERYYLINHIYSKIYNYTKNIKPAPNPYYTLDKFYGNLSIQEYRSLLKNERLFLVVDKPLTRIFPELHEDNDDFIINNKIIPSNNTYQIKKKIQKKQQTKTNILNEKFGLTN